MLPASVACKVSIWERYFAVDINDQELSRWGWLDFHCMGPNFDLEGCAVWKHWVTFSVVAQQVPRDARSNAWVSFDGKRRQQLSKGDSVRISMSEHPLPTVNKSDQTDDWFQSLVRCLNWNERLEQRPLSPWWTCKAREGHFPHEHL